MFEKRGLVHNFGFPGYLRQRALFFHNLARAPQQHIQKYTRRGYTLKNTPSQLDRCHLKKCARRRCRLSRYTDDDIDFNITFRNNADILSTLTPMKPLISWSIGGYECDRSFHDGVYEKASVKVLVIFYFSIVVYTDLTHLS